MKYLLPNFIVAFVAAAIGVSANTVLRNPQLIPVGTDNISQVLCADLNNDGHDDLLVVNSGKALAAILDNGTGPFAAPVITATSYNLVVGGIADVNGDGRKDVVGFDVASQSIVVMLGNGDGSFNAGPTSSTALPTSAEVTAVGDFNGDHLLDVAVGANHSLTQDVFAIYFGDGTGHFSGGATTTVASTLASLTVADLNGDGKSDILARDLDGTTAFVSNGNGTFAAGSRIIDYGATPVTGDFNHDGKVDIASGPNIFFGNGDGTLTYSATYLIGSPGSVTTADLDGDGNVDLIATSNGGILSVLRGNANGSFKTPSRLFLADVYPLNINVADFDRDGKLDVVTSITDPETGRISLSFTRGNGDGTFQAYPAAMNLTASPAVQWPSYYEGACVTADMNNDGKPDAVIIQPQVDDNQQHYDLGVLLNDGTGLLAPPVFTPTGTQRWTLNPDFAIADVNHDGKLDVVVLSNYANTPAGETLLGNGDGTLGTPIPFTVPMFGHPYLADFDGDGIPDLFIGLQSSNFQPHSALQHGNGDGTFATGVTFDTPNADFIFGDVNGDGKLDFIAAGPAGTNSTLAFVNDGSGHFTVRWGTGDAVTAVALADFNGDSKLDLLFRTNTGLQVRVGNGDGTFGAQVAMTLQPVPALQAQRPVVTGDFDGDGKTDVAFGTTIYLGNGDGSFSSRVRLRIQPILYYPNVTDMDGNGSPDLVYFTYENRIAVILTRTTSDPTAQSSITLSADHSQAQYGQPVTFTGTVTGGSIPLTGVVRFAVAGRPVALIAVDANGKAQYTAQFATGSFAVTATYIGDEYYIPSTSEVSLNVVKETTAVIISGSGNPTPQGNPLSIVARIASAATSPFNPPGTITLREGATVLGSVPALGGSLYTPSLTVGSHVITGDYPGDANFEPSSASYTQVITKPVPYLSISVNPSNNVVAGSAVTVHASSTATGITGAVSYYDSSVLIGTVPLVNGAADLQTSFAWGSHSIQAIYSGDNTYAPTQSSTWNLNVYIGSWGTPLVMRAVASWSSAGYFNLTMSWSQVLGATQYTIRYRKLAVDSWQFYGAYGPGVSAIPSHMDDGATWEFAVSATDANGIASAMSAPDLATSVGFIDGTITPGVTALKLLHITELRTAIDSVRTFAGLAVYSYSRTPSIGQFIKTTDILEMRTAISQARSAIGLSISFSDSTLTPGVTPIRAAHIIELRAGVD